MPKTEIKSVLMLIPTFHPMIGGAEKQAMSLSHALSLRGIRVKVLTRRLKGTAEKETVEGVEVERLDVFGPKTLDSFVFMAASFLRMWKTRREYDIVHVHLASSPAVSAILAGWIFRKRVVIKIGGGKGVDEVSLSEKSFWGRLKLRFFSAANPRFLIMNEDILEYLKNTLLTNCRFSLFRNGVDTGKYAPLSYHEKLEAKSRFGFGGRTVFLFVGRLSPEKRVHEFIEAWSEIAGDAECKDKAFLHIVGTGPLEGEIRASIKALGVDDSVIMAGKRYELKDYYSSADVFVLPSLSEGMSNSMLEAMSSGLAVMASSVGGAKRAVEDGVNGFLFDPTDRRKIKSVIIRFMETDKLAADMGEKSREIAVKKFSMSRVVEDLIKMYEE